MGIVIVVVFLAVTFVLNNHFIRREIRRYQERVVREASKIGIVANFISYLKDEGNFSNEIVILTLVSYFTERGIYYGVVGEDFNIESQNHLQTITNHLALHNHMKSIGQQFNCSSWNYSLNFDDADRDILSKVYNGIITYTLVSHDDSLAIAA